MALKQLLPLDGLDALEPLEEEAPAETGAAAVSDTAAATSMFVRPSCRMPVFKGVEGQWLRYARPLKTDLG